MRNLIVCCDGTWNTPDQRHDGVPIPTNVVRLYHALADHDAAGNPQVAYYHPGVGSEGSWWDKVAGGGIGLGLTKNIMSAYRWLGAHYRAGDRICLFGFSRGAYTVRSLAGLITSCGLLDLARLSDDEVWKRVEKAEDAYRDKTRRDRWAKNWKFHGTAPRFEIPIHFIGVWDTVGALGIPNDLAILNLLDRFGRYEFHDTAISDRILNARHAVAVDEKRAPFTPTLWTGGARRATVKQVWFPGVHCDVGGGYRETGLSDGALRWMIDEASDPAIGIAFKPKMVAQVKPDFQDVLHDSFQGPMKALKSRPRSLPLLTRRSSSVVHDSVFQRQEDPPIVEGRYRETTLLSPGDARHVTVYAGDPWNATNLYLVKGKRYRFTAKGQWLDRNIACGPGGADDGKFHVGELAHLAGSLLGTAEGLWRKVTGNFEADLKFTRRREEFDWFQLVGAIGNGALDNRGRMQTHEAIGIGDGCTYSPKQSGYLYCYANDAWGFYDNNKGSVDLLVECLG
jgi:hypothetical protein